MMEVIYTMGGRAVQGGCLGVAWRFKQCRHGQYPFPGAVRRGPQVWTARDRDGGCDSRRFDPVIGCEVMNVSD
jgi:hypothetical protein